MKNILYILNLIINNFGLKINGLIEWYEMKKEKRLESSRDEWKAKAVLRANELREARKLREIHKEKIRLLTSENQELQELQEQLKKN
jgi:hypothetical protein